MLPAIDQSPFQQYDLPPELEQHIFSYLAPSDYVSLSAVSSSLRSVICNDRSYNAIARNLGLPRVFGNSPFRHLCHNYDVISDGRKDMYECLVNSAIDVGDHEWVVSHGIGLMRCNPTNIIRFLVKHNYVDGLRKLVSVLHNESSNDEDLLYMIKCALRFGTVETYQFLEEFRDVIQVAPDSGDIAEIASYGNLALVSHLESRYDIDPARILAGYLLGGHQDLYHKYYEIYDTKERFERDDFFIAVEHANYSGLVELANVGIYRRVETLSLMKTFNNPGCVEFMKNVISDERFDCNIALHPIAFVEVAVVHGNFDIVQLLLEIEDILKSHHTWDDIFSSSMISKTEDCTKCIRAVIGHLKDPSLKDTLTQGAKSHGNLGLIEILEKL